MKSLSITIAAALLIGLAGCSDDNDEPSDLPVPQPATSSPAGSFDPQPSITASRRAAAEAAVGLPDAPSGANARAYITRLREIDPDIVAGASSEALINRGRDQCTTIYQIADKDYVASAANIRFATLTHPAGFGDKAEDINDAVKKYLCPKAWG